MVVDSRYRRAMGLGRLRYGVLSRSRNQSEANAQRKPDRSFHIYSRSILRVGLGSRIRRTKLEGMGPNEGGERTRRRSGKRRETYTTETVKLVRRRRTGAWRVTTGWSTEPRIQAYEYPILVRLATLGLMRLVNANDRIGRYLGIEWLSLCLYVMAAFRRGSAYSTEAGLKYYVVGAFGSAWMLLGISLVYGWRGSVNRREVERRRRVPGREGHTRDTILYRLGWEFIRGALLLKLAGVPRHRWLADVYEGAPRASVLYFTVVPKLGLFYVRVRRVSIWYVQAEVDRVSTSAVTQRRLGVSVRSMRVGAIGALTQRRRKRFRAYSAIGHTGYILLGVRLGTVEGVQGVRIYTRIYVVMTRVRWQRRSFVKVRKADEDPTRVQIRDVKYRTDRYQLGKENPLLGLRVARTCMSMAGVPPMAGFGAKRAVFRAVIGSSYYRLGTRAVRASVVGGFNYIRRVKRIFFEENVANKKQEEICVTLNKARGRRLGREGRFRTGLRVNPSWFLLRTHRMALEVLSR
jgi:NADH-quinone oxidoreductase subunit N